MKQSTEELKAGSMSPDLQRMYKAVRDKGINIDPVSLEQIWKEHSVAVGSSWAHLPDTDKEIISIIESRMEQKAQTPPKGVSVEQSIAKDLYDRTKSRINASIKSQADQMIDLMEEISREAMKDTANTFIARLEEESATCNADQKAGLVRAIEVIKKFGS